jgi:DNA primase
MSVFDASFRDFVERVKDAARIDEVIRDHVPSLVQSGASLKGLCPFHREKTPSFYVHPEMGFYHCFGCGAHGDAIKFIQEIEKIDFMLALEQLARRVGLEMPAFKKGDHEHGEEAERHLTQLRELCVWAGEFFIEQMRSHPRGPLAKEYLKRRGLSDEEIRSYRLGYAPDGYEVLLSAAERRGWKPETVVEAGLASRRDNGGFTDRFRDRVMFPIADRQGQVVAFAGRLIENKEDAPKYINSAETPLFKKNQILYGLAAARDAIRAEGHVILMEGYMDWISMHRHGLANTLAGMGTALTEEQSRLLRRMTGKVILLYDGDAAGQKALYRSTELLLRQALAVHAAVLPAEHDPDSFLEAEGTQAMRDILTQAPPAMDYFIRSSASQFDLGRPEGKAQAVDRLAPLLQAIEEPTLREGYMTRAAMGLGLQPTTLAASMQRRRPRHRDAAAVPDQATSEEISNLQPVDPTQTEQNLLYILLQLRDRWGLLQTIDVEWFQHPILKDLYERIYDCERDAREGADLPSDWFEIADSEPCRHWLSRILLLPMQRFAGEVEHHARALDEALQLQVLKLQKLATQRRKRQLSQDLQSILAEKPLGDGQLDRIHRLSLDALQRQAMFLEGRGPQMP